MKLQTGTQLLCGMMFWLAGFLEVFVPLIILYKYNRSNSFVIVFTCSIAFQWYQTWYGNNYLNLIDCQASQKKDEVLVSLHRATSRDVARPLLLLDVNQSQTRASIYMLTLIGPLDIIRSWSRTRTLITACCPVPLLQSRALGKMSASGVPIAKPWELPLQRIFSMQLLTVLKSNTYCIG